MLSRIKISNFLLIDSLELDFFHGLTVITGETGSGKSIIIDGLMIIFGQKVSSDIIRLDAEFALFEAQFELTNNEVLSWLNENDLTDMDMSNNLICRRVLYKNGKSKVYINGNSVTINQIKQLGDLVLDIHTQHASITLLKNEFQRKLLDQYANNIKLIESLEDVYNQLAIVKNQIKQYQLNMAQNESVRLELTEKYNQLKQLGLEPDTWSNLNNKQIELANSNAILEELNYLYSSLFESNNSDSFKKIINKLIIRVDRLAKLLPKASELNKFLNNIDLELSELEHQINVLVNGVDVDPQSLLLIEEKIDEVFTISRKYKIMPNSILDVITDIEDRLATLNDTNNLLELTQKQEVLQSQYNEISAKISQNRLNASIKLSTEVTKLLHELAIDGVFKIELTPLNLDSVYGVESIEFKVGFNHGIESKALAKVASGGELSRTALALYLLLSIHNPPEVIIFDEIDVGIGGKIAAIVGKLLHQLGKHKQVICITHQAQTASYGDNHLVVSKTSNNANTYSNIMYITKQDRIAEIGRMLSGLHITDTTIKHATELLNIKKSNQ
jgi:DNA repair protein RecN (Recombination protein N)